METTQVSALSHDAMNMLRSAAYTLGPDATIAEIARELRWSVASVRRALASLGTS